MVAAVCTADRLCSGCLFQGHTTEDRFRCGMAFFHSQTEYQHHTYHWKGGRVGPDKSVGLAIDDPYSFATRSDDGGVPGMLDLGIPLLEVP